MIVSLSFSLFICFTRDFPFDFARKGRKKSERHSFFVCMPVLLSLDFEMGVGTYQLEFLNL